MNKDEIVKLGNEIAARLPFKDSKSVRRRMGVNAHNALSIYETSKWYKFGYQLRKQYKSLFPPEVIEKAFTGWFLRIPENGFIDKIATWVNKPAYNMSYYSIALRDNQLIIIDDVPMVFNAGDVCEFCIKKTYEIPRTETEQLWACVLVAN